VGLVGEVVEGHRDAPPFEDPLQLHRLDPGLVVAGADVEVHAERLRERDGREVLAGHVGPLRLAVRSEQVPRIDVVVGTVVARVGDDAGKDVLVTEDEVEGAVPTSGQPAEDPGSPVGDRAVIGVDVADDVGHEVGLGAGTARDVLALGVAAVAAVDVGHDHDERRHRLFGQEIVHRAVEPPGADPVERDPG
jgi:hypothetical protein